MRFVRIIFYFTFIVFSANCQIIEFPEDSNKSNNNNTENVEDKSSEDKNEIDKPNVNNQSDILPVFSRPTEGFSQENSLKLMREYPFTNFDSQGYVNPFYSVLKFLEAVKNSDWKLLNDVTLPALFNSLCINFENTPECWCFMQGTIGLYKGISKFCRISDKLCFKLQTISKSTHSLIVLSMKDNTWRVSNIVKVVNSEKLRGAKTTNKLNLSTIWQGFWNIDSVDNFKFILTKPKLSRFDLLTKMLNDTHENIDIRSSTNYLTSSNSTFFSSNFLNKTPSELDSKGIENQFMINFYKKYKMTDLITVEKFPISENLQIETHVAIFDVKINPSIIVRWFVYDGNPYLERFELPTGSSLQILFNLD